MKPIYKPKGAAAEYGEYAVNIYTGCPHRCYYCFAPQVLRREREAFHGHVEPRKDIVAEVAYQISKDQITGKTIHLCFTCDPYPNGYDTTPTREIIKLLKDSGNHVQILTKGDGRRDFDLLDGGDWYGITLDGKEDNHATSPLIRVNAMTKAHGLGIKTWVSFEPVLNPDVTLWQIKFLAPFTDRVKIGKLNYHPSGINWADFGRQAEALCQQLGLDYYIKDSLRAEMEKVVITAVVAPYFMSKTTAQQQTELAAWVRIAVEAAEQIYIGSGKGAEKKRYVLEWLHTHNITVDESKLDAMIESAVYALKNEPFIINNSVSMSSPTEITGDISSVSMSGSAEIAGDTTQIGADGE